MSTIGSRIRSRRLEVGLSVDELAGLLNKNRATVYRYESDEIDNFPISVIAPLAEALQTTPAYIMGWAESTTEKAADIAPAERTMLGLFRELNDEGQERAINYTDDLVSSGKYIKTPAAGLLQEA